MRLKTFKKPDITPTNFHGMLTLAPQMLKFFELVTRVARTDATVLIRGETGTGKELVARLIHQLSPRSNNAWEAINCATLTPDLLASELFGHIKGSFTGATKDRRGLFLLADGGSLFLDEIAEISLEIQARLLRVLQERVFVPLGGSKSISVDVRLISATNKSLIEEVREKKFREDLMYRVRVVKLHLPRLAERSGDVEMLTWQFIQEFNLQGFRTIDCIDQDAMESLLDYPWPGNIRELRNTIEGAFAIGEGNNLKLNELPPELSGEYLSPNHPKTEKDLERERIEHALNQTHGRKTKAAEQLGMSRATLWRKMREHGM